MRMYRFSNNTMRGLLGCACALSVASAVLATDLVEAHPIDSVPPAFSSESAPKVVGHGEGRIHVIPSLSSPAVKDGEKLTLSAVVKADSGAKGEPPVTPTSTPTITETPTQTPTITQTPTETPAVTCDPAPAPLVVRQDGAGGAYTTISAAIAAATSGDTIQIADNGLYLEDLFIPPTKTNLTLQGCNTYPPTLQAENVTGGRGLWGVIFGLYSLFGVPDMLGLIVEGNGTTLRDLRIRNLSPSGNWLFENNAALTIMADNVTVEGCDIQGSPPSGSDFAGLLVVTGDWPALGAYYMPNIFVVAGYSTPIACSNLTVTDCDIHDAQINIASVDAATFLGLLVSYGGTYIAPMQPSGTWSRVNVHGGHHLAEMAVSQFLFSGCHFHDAVEAFQLEGGSTTIVDSTFEGNLSKNMIVLEADWRFGGGIAEATFENCLVCCNDHDDDRVVRVSEGIARFSNCVLKHTGALQPGPAMIRYSPGDIDSQLFVLPSPFVPPTLTSVTVDHCDIHNPGGIGILGDDPPDPIEPVGYLSVSNSIIHAVTPVLLAGPAGSVTRYATIDHNDLFTGGVPIDNSTHGWILSETATLNEDPVYSAPGICSKAAYRYSNPNLAVAGIGGTELGSQGYEDPLILTPTPTNTGIGAPTYTQTPVPTATITNTVTATRTQTESETPTSTRTSTATHTPSVPPPTLTPTLSETMTPTRTPSGTPTQVATASHTATFSETPTQAISPTQSMTPSVGITPTVTHTPIQEQTPTSSHSPTETATPTGETNYDIWPIPDGDGQVDARDLLEWLLRYSGDRGNPEWIFEFAHYWMDSPSH